MCIYDIHVHISAYVNICIYMYAHVYIYICMYILFHPVAIWRWIGSFRTFSLYVLSFVIYWSPSGVFGAHFGFLGLTLASLWPPFGSLGMPVGPFGVPWATKGAWGDFGSKMDVLSVNISSVCDACAQKVTSRNSAAAAQDPGKVAQGPQLPTPLHSRRGPG